MRRALGLGVVALVLLAPACAGADRPEGLVERWLTSLNQGAAGRPDEFAPAALSEEVLPGWADREPGALDVIEVGRAREFASMRYVEGAALVPFRAVRVSGQELRASALLEHDPDGTGWRIVALRPPGRPLPSEGGPTIGTAPPAAWLAAAAVAAALTVLSAALLSLVRTDEKTRVGRPLVADLPTSDADQ